MNRISFASAVAATALSLSLMMAPVMAAGSGSSSDSGDDTPAKPTAASLGCTKNQVVKQVKKKGKMVWACVDKTAALLSDDELYEQGAALAKQGHYEWALDLLMSIKNQDDPKVLNYIGYSHRKAGRIETGVAFYRKALAINPDFVLAREYLGEGYVAAGRIDLAQVELREIGTRCGVSCEEYKALADVIDKAIN